MLAGLRKGEHGPLGTAIRLSASRLIGPARALVRREERPSFDTTVRSVEAVETRLVRAAVVAAGDLVELDAAILAPARGEGVADVDRARRAELGGRVIGAAEDLAPVVRDALELAV